ncbi:translational activator for mitochondrial COX1 [Vermiconidia calcicola]|uniref:Translational activator for mitochondrial COX1 n=1 Tax=Vermiconidia calcicola TaxID=1690605 RepID=A0ACC3MU11_9PEZI|nr:translational activator for mitochondrial COX1 [Vermiconidia calcicola]
MASKSICSRCLRLAASTPTRRIPQKPQQRAFSSTVSKQPSQERRIHHSSRQKAPEVEAQRSHVPQDIPPYTTNLGQQPSRKHEDSSERTLLQPNNLFHPFTTSPSPQIRRRAATIRQNAYCPHPDHQPTRSPIAPHDTEGRKAGVSPPAHVRHECPDCGIPVSCSEEHFASDYESHLEICDTLRQINEDDHDLVSGRFFPEFEYPPARFEEAQVNMTNWDTLLFSRGFEAVNAERSMRQVTRLLTYPITVGSVLHELSPYAFGKEGRLTPEGLRSLSALRYTLHPPRTGAGVDIKGLRPNPPPVRLFILGARAESSLPREVWVQLSHLFPRVSFHLIFIGPESMANRDDEFPLPPRTPSNPFGAIVEDRLGGQMKVSTYVEYFHTLYEAQHFAPFDPYFDAIILFHPGLGHPASSHEWSPTLPQLLATKIPIICTGYTDYDMQRDIAWVKKEAKGEMDVLLEPAENRFRSLRWDLNDLDPGDVSCGNWGVWGFRGKRYETDEYRGRDG